MFSGNNGIKPVEETKPASVEKAPEPVAEVKPEPVAEVKPEPVEEVKPEPVAEVKPEPVEEVKPEPVAEVKPELVEEAKPEPVAEVKPEPVEEVKPEPVEEVKPEPVEEVKPESVKPEPVPSSRRRRQLPPRRLPRRKSEWTSGKMRCSSYSIANKSSKTFVSRMPTRSSARMRDDLGWISLPKWRRKCPGPSTALRTQAPSKPVQ